MRELEPESGTEVEDFIEADGGRHAEAGRETGGGAVGIELSASDSRLNGRGGVRKSEPAMQKPQLTLRLSGRGDRVEECLVARC